MVFDSPSDVKHDGITLSVEGTVNLQLSPKNVGIFEAFYNSLKVSVNYYLLTHVQALSNAIYLHWSLIKMSYII